MPTDTTYTSLRANLSSVLDHVIDDQEIVIVRRTARSTGQPRDVALIPATELASLTETAHLLRSPRNARRLLTALRRAERQSPKPSTLAKLRKDLKLAPQP